jgi:hypothetical protein
MKSEAEACGDGGHSEVDPERHATWTIARILQAHDPESRLRSAFLENPLLSAVTLQDLVDPSALDDFLRECRRLPGCGKKTLGTVDRLLSEEIAKYRMISPGVPSSPSSGRSPSSLQGSATGLGMYPSGWSSFVGALCPDTIDGMQDVFLRQWRAAHFSTFVYLPVSLPEFIKTPAVLLAELGEHHYLSEYGQRMMGLRRSLALIGQARGDIFLDSQMLSAILDRQGRYAGLRELDVSEQLAALTEFASNLPEGTECVVVDFERSRLSSVSIVGEDIVLYAMGGYIHVRDPRVRGIFLTRCESARRHAQTLESFLTPWQTRHDRSID